VVPNESSRWGHFRVAWPILETFQTETGGLKHNEIKEHGFYRTKEWVLAEYDRVAAAETSDVPYESTLKQKPGDGPRHPAR